MLEAYFDDSGRGNGPVFLLGGFLSTTEKWAAFGKDWKSILDREPKLKRLKMQHAMTGSKAWLPWDREARNARLDLFHTAIQKHALFGFACVVHHREFEELFRNNIKSFDTIYSFGFMGVIGTTMRYHCQLGLKDKVKFVFDDQGVEFDRVLNSFLHLWQADPYLQGYIADPPRSMSDDEALPLQAADYLMWQLRRMLAFFENPSGSDRRLTIAPPGQHAPERGDIPIMVDIWDRSRLEGIRNDFLTDRLAELDDSQQLSAEIRDRIHNFLLPRRDHDLG